MRIFLSILFLVPYNLFGQTIIFQETFEDAFDSDYIASDPFNDSGNDHWNRTDGSDINNITSDYTGFSGSFFWAAEDTDDNGGNGNDEQTIDISGIDITDFESLQITGLFGAGNESGPGSSAYDAADYIKIQYSIDGGGFNDILWFSYVDNGDNFNEPIAFDSNFDGDGEGAVLQNDMQLFTGSLPQSAAGSVMNIRILVFMDSGNEEIAFDDITVLGQEVLPVEYTSITAKPYKNGINIEWTTVSETNNDRFEIHRSIDGKSFEKITELAGSGNSYARNEYQYLDTDAQIGINYYRIKQVDFDGKYDYSKVVSLMNRESNITVAPTSTYDLFTITVDQEANSDIYVYNIAGQMVTSLSNISGVQTIDASAYSKGTYIVTVVTNGITQTEKVVKL